MLFCLRRASPGQDDDPLIGIETADLLQDGNPPQLRHFEIQHDDIGTLSPKQFYPLPTTIGEDYGVTFSAEKDVEKISDSLLIIDHENFGHDSSQYQNSIDRMQPGSLYL